MLSEKFHFGQYQFSVTPALFEVQTKFIKFLKSYRELEHGIKYELCSSLCNIF
jgi:hypothetical protein